MIHRALEHVLYCATCAATACDVRLHCAIAYNVTFNVTAELVIDYLYSLLFP